MYPITAYCGVETADRLQFRVFCVGQFENRDVRVGVPPETQELLIGAFGLNPVARDSVCSAQLQVCQGAYRIGVNDAPVIEDFLKFRRGLVAAPCAKICLTADIRRIAASELPKN